MKKNTTIYTGGVSDVLEVTKNTIADQMGPGRLILVDLRMVRDSARGIKVNLMRCIAKGLGEDKVRFAQYNPLTQFTPATDLEVNEGDIVIYDAGLLGYRPIYEDSKKRKYTVVIVIDSDTNSGIQYQFLDESYLGLRLKSEEPVGVASLSIIKSRGIIGEPIDPSYIYEKDVRMCEVAYMIGEAVGRGDLELISPDIYSAYNDIYTKIYQDWADLKNRSDEEIYFSKFVEGVIEELIKGGNENE